MKSFAPIGSHLLAVIARQPGLICISESFFLSQCTLDRAYFIMLEISRAYESCLSAGFKDKNNGYTLEERKEGNGWREMDDRRWGKPPTSYHPFPSKNKLIHYWPVQIWQEK